MRILVEEVREVSQLMGSGEKVAQACEKELHITVRRSIGAARDISVGTLLTASDLTWIRPGTGIAPGEEDLVLGRKVKRALRKGELITPDDIDSS